MKQYLGMAKLIKKFIGNNCEVFHDSMFAYYPAESESDEAVITFSFTEDEESNREWKKFLNEYFGFRLTKENLFTMSVLHELGHHFTVHQFSLEEWNEQDMELSIRGLQGKERDQAYFRLGVEIAATEWAIKTYNAFPEVMRVWNHRFACAIRHQEKKAKRKLLTDL